MSGIPVTQQLSMTQHPAPALAPLKPITADATPKQSVTLPSVIVPAAKTTASTAAASSIVNAVKQTATIQGPVVKEGSHQFGAIGNKL